MTPPPSSDRLGPPPDLKDRVRDYWNRHVCGSGYAVSPEHGSFDFASMAEARYELEPYILDLADFHSGRGRKVLEIGVGGGVDFESWIRHGAVATGIDLTSAGVHLTRTRLDHNGVPRESYTLGIGDTENLQFADNSFDIVYSYGVLHHTPDTERAFREVFRVLAPGGTFRGMVYHTPSIVGYLLWLRYCLPRGRIWVSPRRAVYGHLESPGTKAYTVQEMHTLLMSVGFPDIQVRPQLSFGDLLLQQRSTKYLSGFYGLVWRLYPRRLVRMLGDRFGNALLIVARKPGGYSSAVAGTSDQVRTKPINKVGAHWSQRSMHLTGLFTLRSVGLFPGRALLAQSDGTLYIGSHGRVYRSADDGRTWTHRASLPRRFGQTLIEASRLAGRLFRHEIKALGVLSDGTVAAADRRGVYFAAPGDRVMTRSALDDQGRRVKPPMTITVGPNDRLLWGEYNSAYKHNLPIRLFVSDDRGRSYQVAYVFEAGDILHIHNLLYDLHERHYWVLTGDHGHEAGIGRLSEDLKTFDWIARGRQSCRAVEVFDFGDYMIYGTDSERASNAVIRFDKRTGRTERLQKLEGSCIYACRFGGLYVLSTTVEPSRVNFSRYACLYASRDGERWTKVLEARKDRWPGVYFQFGSLVLPRGASDKETILFSGQALEGLDGRALVGKLSAEQLR